MRHASKTAALVAAALAALTLPTAASATTRVLAADPLESALVAQMNHVRRAHGLRALHMHPRLRSAGNAHALNMARNGYFAHRWSNGSPFASWIRGYWPGTSNYRAWYAGENLYWQGPTTDAVEVVNAWLESPTHRHNLLKPDWRSVGVGAVQIVDPFGAYRGVPTAVLVAAEYGYIRN